MSHLIIVFCYYHCAAEAERKYGKQFIYERLTGINRFGNIYKLNIY